MRLKISVFIGFLLLSPSLSAQDWVEDSDGDIGPNEYRTIDPKGGVTRRPCPYTCEMRAIPKEHCKEWKSITNAQDGECYVQDLRISKSDAMPNDTRDEASEGIKPYK